MTRRGLLGLAVAAPMSACAPTAPQDAAGPSSVPMTGSSDPAVSGIGKPAVVRYGSDPSQLYELMKPQGPSRGVVVVIHGGFWLAQYDLSLGSPLATDLVKRGWVTLNIEYRRIGNGGGWPETFDDVAAAIDSLAETKIDTSTVVTMGHSAGGHLAVWAAGRGAHGWPETVKVTHAISQAGVLDLVAGASLGQGAVGRFLGDRAPDDTVDPVQQVPLAAPVWAVHGEEDDIVPLTQSASYVEAAQAVGAEATLVTVPGGHFEVIDTTTPAWDSIIKILDDISPPM